MDGERLKRQPKCLRDTRNVGLSARARRNDDVSYRPVSPIRKKKRKTMGIECACIQGDDVRTFEAYVWETSYVERWRRILEQQFEPKNKPHQN